MIILQRTRLWIFGKEKGIFVNPVTHGKTQSNEFGNVYFHFISHEFLHMITALHLKFSK